jgi:hypothetical protein
MIPGDVIAGAVAKIGSLLAKLPAGVLGHVYDFAKALVDGDGEAAKRAATSAATERLFKAPVNRPGPPKPPVRK